MIETQQILAPAFFPQLIEPSKNFLKVGTLLTLPLPAQKMRVAVYDIGSNSIRLTIFECSQSGPKSIYDEKEFCKLGDGMVGGNMSLNKKGKIAAIKALKNFRPFLSSLKVNLVIPIGTAAVRMAKDKVFNEEMQEAVGHDIMIVDELQESILTALGLLHGIPNAHGLCFGIGGRSGHYSKIINGTIAHDTLGEIKAGILSLAEESKGDPDNIPALMRKHFLRAEEKLIIPNGIFYAGGGAWRDVGRELFERINNTPIFSNAEHGHPFERSRKLTAALEEMMHPTKQGEEHMKNIEKAAEILLSHEDFHMWEKAREDRRKNRPISTATLAYAFEESQAEQLIFFRHGIRHGALALCGYAPAGLHAPVIYQPS